MKARFGVYLVHSFMHMCVGSCVSWFMYGSQRIILGVQFSLSTIWDLRLNAVCQHGIKCLYLLKISQSKNFIIVSEIFKTCDLISPNAKYVFLLYEAFTCWYYLNTRKGSVVKDSYY